MILIFIIARIKHLKVFYNFITEYDLNIDKLTEYLLQTQKNKIYMLYKNNHFTLETVDLNNYTIIDVEKIPNIIDIWQQLLLEKN